MHKAQILSYSLEVSSSHKPGKPPNEISSYRTISLLPILSNLPEKLFLNGLKPIIVRDNLMPDHQFVFREHHYKGDQIHRLTNTYCDFLYSFLSDWYLRVKQEDEYSDIEKIDAGARKHLRTHIIPTIYFRSTNRWQPPNCNFCWWPSYSRCWQYFWRIDAKIWYWQDFCLDNIVKNKA